MRERALARALQLEAVIRSSSRRRRLSAHSFFCVVAIMALFAEISARQREFMRLFNAGDPKVAQQTAPNVLQGAASIYDPDGHFMPNGATPVKGRAGIERYFKQDMSEGVQTAQIITEEVNGSGDWAFERGAYHLDGARGKESGAYLLVNGDWLIHNDCFNVIKPAAAPAK